MTLTHRLGFLYSADLPYGLSQYNLYFMTLRKWNLFYLDIQKVV